MLIFSSMVPLSSLHQLGFSERESAIYLACLEHGPLNIAQIARYTHQKRTTIAYTLNSLLTRGLLLIVRRNRRTLYDAEPPKKILTSLKQQQHAFEEQIPKLECLRNARVASPSVNVYEGEEGVRRVYDDIYAHIDRRYELCCVTSLKDIYAYAPYAADNYFRIVRNKKSLHIKELLVKDECVSRYLKTREEQRITTELKILADIHPIYNDLILFRDTVYLFSFGPRLYTTVIHDPKIYQTMRSLFQWLWEQSALIP